MTDRFRSTFQSKRNGVSQFSHKVIATNRHQNPSHQNDLDFPSRKPAVADLVIRGDRSTQINLSVKKKWIQPVQSQSHNHKLESNSSHQDKIPYPYGIQPNTYFPEGITQTILLKQNDANMSKTTPENNSVRKKTGETGITKIN